MLDHCGVGSCLVFSYSCHKLRNGLDYPCLIVGHHDRYQARGSCQAILEVLHSDRTIALGCKSSHRNIVLLFQQPQDMLNRVMLNVAGYNVRCLPWVLALPLPYSILDDPVVGFGTSTGEDNFAWG
jgi:hypothetical protein